MKWNLVCNDCTTSVLFIFYSCCCCYCCFCCSIQLYWSISQIYGIQNKSKYLLLLLLQCWTILFIEWINSSRNLNSLSFGRGCMFFFLLFSSEYFHLYYYVLLLFIFFISLLWFYSADRFIQYIFILITPSLPEWGTLSISFACKLSL